MPRDQRNVRSLQALSAQPRGVRPRSGGGFLVGHHWWTLGGGRGQAHRGLQPERYQFLSAIEAIAKSSSFRSRRRNFQKPKRSLSLYSLVRGNAVRTPAVVRGIA